MKHLSQAEDSQSTLPEHIATRGVAAVLRVSQQRFPTARECCNHQPAGRSHRRASGTQFTHTSCSGKKPNHSKPNCRQVLDKQLDGPSLHCCPLPSHPGLCLGLQPPSWPLYPPPTPIAPSHSLPSTCSQRDPVNTWGRSRLGPAQSPPVVPSPTREKIKPSQWPPNAHMVHLSPPDLISCPFLLLSSSLTQIQLFEHAKCSLTSGPLHWLFPLPLSLR